MWKAASIPAAQEHAEEHHWGRFATTF